ncbi:MAG: DUF1292 domain-containing protein [bacterium]|nr:DUF1292 domain-containing protein [bacterium]
MKEEEKRIIDEKLKNKEKDLSDDMFIGFNENGEEKTFYKLLEFDSTETGKHYLAYTDNEKDENDNLKAYGSIVVSDGNYMRLEAITDEKEWKVIETALRVLQEELKGNNEE